MYIKQWFSDTGHWVALTMVPERGDTCKGSPGIAPPSCLESIPGGRAGKSNPEGSGSPSELRRQSQEAREGGPGRPQYGGQPTRLRMTYSDLHLLDSHRYGVSSHLPPKLVCVTSSTQHKWRYMRMAAYERWWLSSWSLSLFQCLSQSLSLSHHLFWRKLDALTCEQF